MQRSTAPVYHTCHVAAGMSFAAALSNPPEGAGAQCWAVRLAHRPPRVRVVLHREQPLDARVRRHGRVPHGVAASGVGARGPERGGRGRVAGCGI